MLKWPIAFLAKGGWYRFYFCQFVFALTDD